MPTVEIDARTELLLADVMRAGPYANATEAIRMALAVWMDVNPPVELDAEEMEGLLDACDQANAERRAGTLTPWSVVRAELLDRARRGVSHA